MRGHALVATSAGGERSRRLQIRRATAFAGAGGLLAYLAFEGGGYDIVIRQEIALVVWSVVALGLGLGLLPRGRLPRLAWIPFAAAVALAVWIALSLLWTQSAERSTAELARFLGYFGFVVLACIGLNRHTFRAAAAGITAAAVAVVAVAVASRLSPSTFPHALDVAQRFGRSDRLDFPLDYWNAVGTWGAMTAVACLAWSAHARSRVLRAVNLAVVPVASLAVYLSYSRGGALAAAVGLVAVVALSHHRWTTFIHGVAAAGGAALAILTVRAHDQIANATGSAGADAVALALLGAAVIAGSAVLVTTVVDADRARLSDDIPSWVVRTGLVCAAVIALLVSQGPISRAWDQFRSEDTPRTAADPAARLTTAGGNRDDIWSFAIDLFQQKPLTGVGPGTFEFSWQSDGGDPEYVRDAHSLYLEFLAELGIVGLVLLLGFLGGGVALALVARRTLESSSDRGAHTAMLGAFVVFAVSAGVDWMWEETAVGAFGLASLAVAGAAGATRLRRERRRGVVVRPGVRSVVIAAAVLAAVVQIPGLISTERARDSASAIAAGEPETAKTLAQDAVDAEPWSASAHSRLAIALRDQGNPSAAIAEIQTAIDKEPDNWRWPLILAPLQVVDGDRKAAIATFEGGRKLAPALEYYSPFSYYGERVYSPDQLQRIYDRRVAIAAAEAG